MNANSLDRLSTDAGIPDTGVMVSTPDEWQPLGSSWRGLPSRGSTSGGGGPIADIRAHCRAE
jgi:hypothetical protein